MPGRGRSQDAPAVRRLGGLTTAEDDVLDLVRRWLADYDQGCADLEAELLRRFLELGPAQRRQILHWLFDQWLDQRQNEHRDWFV